MSTLAYGGKRNGDIGREMCACVCCDRPQAHTHTLLIEYTDAATDLVQSLRTIWKMKTKKMFERIIDDFEEFNPSEELDPVLF